MTDSTRRIHGATKSPPEALVIFGSSRGSTQQVADAIAEGLNGAGAQGTSIKFDLLSMMSNRVESADIVGLGSPVYFLREPSYMAKVVAELPSLDGKKAFVFCTCGMDRMGETLERLSDMLSKRGADVVGAEPFRSAMSYLPYRKRGLGNPAHLPDAAELAVARQFGERMARAVELEEIRLDPPTPDTRRKARLLANARFRRSFFPSVHLEKSICTGYGSCITRCPFVGLDREDDDVIPDFTESCIQCLECIDSCPRSALVVPSRTKEWISTLSYRLGIH